MTSRLRRDDAARVPTLVRVLHALVLTTFLLVPGGLSAQDAPTAPAPAIDAVPVIDAAPVGPRREPSSLEMGSVRAPIVLPAAEAPAGADLHVLQDRGSGKGKILLFALGLVVVGGATYKLGEALEVGAIESTGAFMAGAGLLMIVLPIWIFY